MIWGINGGTATETKDAMDLLGYTYDLRDASNPITAADLATHEVLIIGWNAMGDTSGISSALLASGITGNILLTGHDADYHTLYGFKATEAATFLTQAITFASSGSALV